MNAIMCCVDFADILAITLPFNRNHFKDVWVVTSEADVKTQEVALANDANLFITNCFWDRGATFNKFLALEKGLDVMGRHGWICQMDADVLWPRSVKLDESPDGNFLMFGNHSTTNSFNSLTIKVGQLCSPLRRMWNEWPNYPDCLRRHKYPMPRSGVPQEEMWKELPIHHNIAEWAGYSQIFHANDPVLDPPPWHEVDWIHAGGADSFFQQMWSSENKVRPPFECLHLGQAGQNWFGRATPLVDGTVLDGSEERAARNRNLWKERRMSGFTKEKLS